MAMLSSAVMCKRSFNRQASVNMSGNVKVIENNEDDLRPFGVST